MAEAAQVFKRLPRPFLIVDVNRRGSLPQVCDQRQRRRDQFRFVGRELRQHIDHAVHHAGREFFEQPRPLGPVKPGDAEHDFISPAAELLLHAFEQDAGGGVAALVHQNPDQPGAVLFHRPREVVGAVVEFADRPEHPAAHLLADRTASAQRVRNRGHGNPRRAGDIGNFGFGRHLCLTLLKNVMQKYLAKRFVNNIIPKTNADVKRETKKTADIFP